jgi:hypothetical protein
MTKPSARTTLQKGYLGQEDTSGISKKWEPLSATGGSLSMAAA